MAEARRRRAAIPSLAEYLARHVTDGRSHGFEAFMDFAQRTLALTQSHGLKREAAQARWLKVMTVAFVETLNAENARDEDYDETLACVARTLGFLIFDLIIAHCEDGAPLQPLLEGLCAEFRRGAQTAIAALEARAPGDAS